ncbi:Mucin-19 [Streptomyces venezuelae]|uniref:Mucin-19 n=1 Tax=Streptomyces venezuelae TaxID=54571 RepID=UPI003419648F
MDHTEFTARLPQLREIRDARKKAASAVTKAQAALDKAQAALAKIDEKRDAEVRDLAAYEKATPARLAPAAGLSVIDIVKLAPHLAPQGQNTDTAAQHTADSPAHPANEDEHAASSTAPTIEAPAALATTPPTGPAPTPAAPPLDQTTAPADAASSAITRELPTIPSGASGDAFFQHHPDPKMVSRHPDYSQQVRPMACLDTTAGVLVYQGNRVSIDVGSGTAGEIITAVCATIPSHVTPPQRIFITNADTSAPWHRDLAQYPYMKDAVAAWLNAPLPPGWEKETQRGDDIMADHFVHERNPVGRWQRRSPDGVHHLEIRNAQEWFDTEGSDAATVYNAFGQLFTSLKREWPDAVLMGSPMQLGRDLWTRTIPTGNSRWAEGYPVLSDELRQLLHATSGQGRTELITPPRVPETLPQFIELDRTLAYGKHTSNLAVGVPERVTAHRFAAWTTDEQAKALYRPSHWHIRVTIPTDWQHVGILPAPIEGDRAWTYPHEAGRTFTTWASGAEVHVALNNPIQPWKIEVLDGLMWEQGNPIKTWADKLKKCWAELSAWSQQAGDENQRKAFKLASRGVRSVLLYGIGGFAQRPTTTTGSVPRDQMDRIPKGAVPIGMTDDSVTWQRTTMSKNPKAHPEWAAGVWGKARAALLDMTVNEAGVKTKAGALHLPPRSIVAFRTDAIYSTVQPDWPDRGQPGDYRIKGFLPNATAPRTDEDFFKLQALGRAYYEEQHTSP